MINKLQTKPITEERKPRRYLAVRGMNLDGLKPPVRIEEDDPIPAEVSEKEIQELLEISAIKEAKNAAHSNS